VDGHLAGCRVAIVEQDATLRGMLAASLTRTGCDVVFTCSTRPDVRKLVARFRPDVLVFDAVVQHTVLREVGAVGDLVVVTSLTEDMDGFELLRQLAHHHPQTRILAWSSSEGRDALYRAYAAGATDFLEDSHPTIASILHHVEPLCPRHDRT